MFLTDSIIKYIFWGFGINPFNLPSKIIPVCSYNTILPGKLNFGKKQTSVWGIQTTYNNIQIKILILDCTQDDFYPEFAITIRIDNSTYGCYKLFNENDLAVPTESLIGIAVDSKWSPASILVQGNLLVACEQFKYASTEWTQIKDYSKDLELAKSFVNFHFDYFEEENAGQED